jgi:hypothetical protein
MGDVGNYLAAPFHAYVRKQVLIKDQLAITVHLISAGSIFARNSQG